MVGRRAELLKIIRERYAHVEVASALWREEIEPLIDAYLETLRDVLGDAVDDPALMDQFANEIKAAALEDVLSNAEQLDRLHQSRLSEIEETEPVGYAYLGQSQANTRPFCKYMTGKWLTREEIDKIPPQDEQLPEVFISRGGFNCHHGWYPIYAGEENEFPRGSLSQASAAMRLS